MELSSPMKSITIVVYAILMLLGFVKASGISLEWAVVGDSWASAVAYNSSNVYKPTDTETCYRSKEAWGVQMANDDSWSVNPQDFQFAACGGTLMDDLKRQMQERAGRPDIVWGMFGGNDASFGAIARACIYQPISPNHPLGWGKPWDEDSDGTGLCKINIEQSGEYISGDTGFRQGFIRAVNDIIEVAQDTHNLNQPFDLYVSSYVRFFDNNTDACDEWTFAHENLSTGKPKLVKELRTIINDKVQQVNDIQADVIKNYQIPPRTPFNPNFRVHNSQPDSIFDGHRFCESDHTFEDQYYNQNVWLWNLQYYDEKTGEEVGVATTNNGVEFMAPPNGLDVTQGFETVLGADTNPNASIPQGGDTNTLQYGFGWTARPFHPKFVGHTALKDFFIQQMRNDNIPGVKPPDSTPPAPTLETAPSVPTPTPQLTCNGLQKRKYVERDRLADHIQKEFCPDAVKQGGADKDSGSFFRSYDQGTLDEVSIIIDVPPGTSMPSESDCETHLLAITDDCDGNDPNNPANFKGGGQFTVGINTYHILPQTLRQPASNGVKGGCDSTYKVLFNEYTLWGAGWDSADSGAQLQNQLEGCALLPDTWSFSYGLGSDGREWTAKFRTGVFQKKCTGDAGKTASGIVDFGCSGSG